MKPTQKIPVMQLEQLKQICSNIPEPILDAPALKYTKPYHWVQFSQGVFYALFTMIFLLGATIALSGALAIARYAPKPTASPTRILATPLCNPRVDEGCR